MGNDYYRAVILLESFLKNLLGNHVEMVGWFIHDEEICWGGDHPSQGQPTFLTP